MRRIAERAEIGIVRRYDYQLAAGPQHAMKLLHRANDVRYMLDHVNGAYLVERAVAERIWKAVQVAQDICARVRIAVDPDRPRIFVDAAPHIEHARRLAIHAHSV